MKRLLILFSILLLVISLTTAVYAGDKISVASPVGEVSLTYEKALEMALSNSNTYRNAGLDIDRAYEVRKNVSDKVKYVPLDPSNIDAGKAFTGLVQADLGWRMSKKTYDLTRDAISLAVRQSYNAVLQAQQKKKLADLALEEMSAQKYIVEMKYQNGLASALERDQYKGNLTVAKENQKAAVKALDDAFVSVNSLTGLPAGSRPVLSGQPQLKVMEEVDLDNKAAQVKDISPSVWLADQNINIARLTLDLFNPNDTSGSDNYETKKIDVTKQTNKASDEKNKLDKTVRSLYYKIRQLEEQYSGLQANLHVAERSLKIARVKHEIGMSVKADLLSSQLAVEKTRQQMLDIAAQHENLVMAFEKPWAYQ